MVDFLNWIFAASSHAVFVATATILALAAIAGLLIYRIRLRGHVLVYPFKGISAHADVDVDALSDAMNAALNEFFTLHQDSQRLGAVGEISNKLDRPAPASDNLVVESSAEVLDYFDLPIPFVAPMLLKVIDMLWPLHTIQGEYIVSQRMLKVFVSYRHGKQLVACGHAETILDNECYLVVAEKSVASLVTSNSPHLGITAPNTESLIAMTHAMKLWRNVLGSDGNGMKQVVSMLESASQGDDYPLPVYNLGVVEYDGVHSSVGVRRALQHFRRAEEICERRSKLSDEETLRDTLNAQRGMALLGQSRCCSQLVHRWGEHDNQEIAEEAVKTAHQAAEIIGENARTDYAIGFASHCDESIEGIRKAIPYYQRVMEREGGTYPEVFINASWICAVAARLLGEKSPGEARAWLESGLRYADEAVKWQPRKSPVPRVPNGRSYAYSNRAYIFRMLSKYDAAFQDAVEVFLSISGGDATYSDGVFEVRSVPRYPNGLNSTSLICLGRFMERGDHKDLDQSLALHREALMQSNTLSHQQRSIKEYLHVCRQHAGKIPVSVSEVSAGDRDDSPLSGEAIAVRIGMLSEYLHGHVGRTG